jgi:hypothetical protein
MILIMACSCSLLPTKQIEEGELVFLAMTIPDYEVMAYNMQELKRYISELKDVVVYYRTVTTTKKGE